MNKKMLLGILLIAILSCFTFVQTVQAIVVTTAIILLGVFIAGIVAGGVIGWYVTDHYQRLSLKEDIGDDLCNETSIEMANLLSAVEQEYLNEKELIASSVYYFMRKAEYGVQYYLNETTFPYQKVMTQSGLHDDMESLFNGTVQHLESIRSVTEGQAELKFTGDMSDYTINSMIVNGTDSSIFTDTWVNLKNNDLEVRYGFVEKWDCPENFSPFTWSGANFVENDDYGAFSHAGAGNQSALAGQSFYLPEGVRLNFTFYADHSASGDNTAIIEILDASDDSVYWSGSEVFTDAGEQITISTVPLNLTTNYKLKLTNTGLAGDVTHWGVLGCSIITDHVPNCRDVLYPTYFVSDGTYVGSGVWDLQYYDTGDTTEITLVQLEPLLSSVKDYCDTMKLKIKSGMDAGQSYWTYLKGLGYDEFSDLSTLIPMPDLLMPPTNATFWGANIGKDEWYAILGAYMQSLKELFEDPDVGRKIDAVNFSDIEFVNLPVYAKGHLYWLGENGNTTSGLCSSIWLNPLGSGNITLNKNTNCTIGMNAQVVYKLNSTGVIYFTTMDSDDKIYPTEILQRSKDGTTVTELNTVVLETATLEKYSTSYITGYSGLGLAFDTENLMTLMMPILMIAIIFSIMGGLFKGSRTRKKRKRSSSKKRRKRKR